MIRKNNVNVSCVFHCGAAAGRETGTRVSAGLCPLFHAHFRFHAGQDKAEIRQPVHTNQQLRIYRFRLIQTQQLAFSAAGGGTGNIQGAGPGRISGNNKMAQSFEKKL